VQFEDHAYRLAAFGAMLQSIAENKAQLQGYKPGSADVAAHLWRDKARTNSS